MQKDFGESWRIDPALETLSRIEQEELQDSPLYGRMLLRMEFHSHQPPILFYIILTTIYIADRYRKIQASYHHHPVSYTLEYTCDEPITTFPSTAAPKILTDATSSVQCICAYEQRGESAGVWEEAVGGQVDGGGRPGREI